MKDCPHCKQTLPDEKFYLSKSTGEPTGYCKLCAGVRQKAWRLANPKRQQELIRRWNAAHPERLQALAEKHRRARKRETPRTCLRCKVCLPGGTRRLICDLCRAKQKQLERTADRERKKRNNPDKWRRDRLDQLQRRKARHQDFISNYKQSHPCLCGESDPIALDLHHRNPAAKTMGFARLMSKALEVIKKELELCVVVCANCHRKGHANRPRFGHSQFFHWRMGTIPKTQISAIAA